MLGVTFPIRCGRSSCGTFRADLIVFGTMIDELSTTLHNFRSNSSAIASPLPFFSSSATTSGCLYAKFMSDVIADVLNVAECRRYCCGLRISGTRVLSKYSRIKSRDWKVVTSSAPVHALPFADAMFAVVHDFFITFGCNAKTFDLWLETWNASGAQLVMGSACRVWFCVNFLCG